MNKKFFSAVLMGALLLGGTFVSCQDYDDDIDNLQEQIDKLASADQLSSKVSELQSAISAAQSAAEAKAATAQAAADAAKTAAGNAASKDDVKAAQAAAQEYADGLKSYADDAAAKAAQKVADQLAGAATMEDVNKAIEKALEDYKSLLGLADELKDLQDAIAKAVTEDQLKALADRVAALETAGVPGVAAAAASIAAPAQAVKVGFQYAVWDKPKDEKKLGYFEELAKVYPEILNIEKDSLVKQGGHLPVIVNPANVDLTEGYAFSLQTIDGKVASDITVGAPVAGLVGAEKLENGALVTKAANGSSCIWTLSAVPAKASKKAYKDLQKTASLVVENEDGTVLRTAFAYTVVAAQVKGDVSIAGGQAAYAEVIDLIGPGADGTVPLNIGNGFVGYQLVKATNAYQKAKYGIEIKDNRYLVINKMPEDVTSITVDLEVIALGLTGDANKGNVTITVVQKLVSDLDEGLKERKLELNGKDQYVTWDFSDLGINPEEQPITLENLMTANPQVKVSMKVGNTELVIFNGAVKFYDKDGAEVAYTNHAFTKAPVAFGFPVNATKIPVYADGTKVPGAGPAKVQAPATYKILFSTSDANKKTVLTNVETTLKTTLPSSIDGFIKIADGFNDNGVVRIIGDTTGIVLSANQDSVLAGKIVFNLQKALVLANGVSYASEDMKDGGFNKKSDTKPNSSAYYNYLPEGKDKYVVNIWRDKFTGTDGCTAKHEWSAAEWNQFNQRTVKVKLKLWNNEADTAWFNIPVKVVSPVYSADGSTVTFDNSKLVTKYDGAAIDVKAAFKSAVYAAGPKKGQTYNLFSGVTEEVGDQSKPITAGGYVMNKAGNDYVIVSSAYYIETFGWKADYPTTASTGYKLKAKDWADGQERLEKFYTLNEQTGNLDVAKEVYVKYDKKTNKLVYRPSDIK